MKRVFLSVWCLLWWVVPVVSSGAELVVVASDWKGFTKQSFELKGKGCFVVEPAISAPGKPWVWRTSFPDYHPEVDLELLHNGFHVGFINCVDMLGADPALDLMDAFYERVREEWQLAERPCLEAVSRGGLHAYRYAARHPERIAAIYADTPVMDLKSWPLRCHGANKQVAEARYHFKLPEVYESVQFVMRHAYVLPSDREYFELRDGLANCREAFEKTGKGRVAFLGGSITYNGGWRDELMRYFKKRFPNTVFEFVAAGIPSMGSVPHAFRLETEVLAKGPIDLLFVEAAVNDGLNNPEHPERMLRGMEGVVRHVHKANPMTDIVQMHFAMPSHMDDYRKGKVPEAVAQHEKVAQAYGCVSLNLAREVTDRIDAGEFSWKDDFRNLHPSPYGQRVYVNSMMRMLEAAFRMEGMPAKHELPETMLDPKSYSAGSFGALADAKKLNGFQLVASWKPADKKGTRPGYVDVPALVASGAGASFSYDFEGRGIGLLITSGPDAGVIEFSIDGGDFREIDTITPWSSGLHLPWALILDDGLSDAPHSLVVRTTGKAKGRAALRIFQFLVN